MKKITLFISVLLFTLSIKAQCNEPSNIHIKNMWFEISIKWDDNGEDNWDIEFGDAGFVPTGTPSIEDLSYPSIDLAYNNPFEPNIYIDLYVRADCGIETSDWIGPVTFYNHCFDRAWSNFLVEEDFDNDFLPICWTESNLGTPNTGIGMFGESAWENVNFANNSSNSLGAKLNLHGTGVNDWLILPPMRGLFGVRDDWNLIMDFEIALTEANSTNPTDLGSDDVIKVVISPDLGETWFTIHQWDANSVISNVGEHFGFAYPNFTHGFDLFEKVFLVAFWASSGNIDDPENVDFFIDDIWAEPPFSGSVTDLKSKGFSFYPNPSENTIKLSAKEPINQVVIYNSLGQKLKEIPINALNKQIAISDLPNGIYFMHVRIGDTIGVVSVIKN